MGANKNRERAQAILRRAIDEGECVFDGQYLSGMSNKLIGTLGEELAACYLEGRGYEIIERNYRCPEGEADIIAHDSTPKKSSSWRSRHGAALRSIHIPKKP